MSRIPRVLEPEAMDTPEEVMEYDAMDHSEVNRRFVADFLAVHGSGRGGRILDVGTGTARIPMTLAKTDQSVRIVALDLAAAMLAQARINLERAGLSDRVQCLLADVKGLTPALGDESFAGVISNSIVHHIPEPSPAIAAMIARVAPGGTLFVRDLARPETREDLLRLGELHAGGESARGRALFEASLGAALALDEARAMVVDLGLPADSVAMTSDRHWTLAWRQPG